MDLSKLSIFNRVSLKDRAFLAREMSIMLGAGITLDKALRILSDRNKNSTIRLAMEEILTDIEAGQKFSVAITKHPEIFDNIFVNVVLAGEAAGKLDEVLIKVSDWLEEQNDFYSKLKNALVYPVFIIIVMIIIGIIMIVKVIPQLQEVFSSYQASLPWTTKALISFSVLLTKYWWLFITGLVSMFYAIIYWSKLTSGRHFFDKIKIIEPTGLGQDIYMSRFSRTMHLLLKSGVSIINALDVSAATINNVWYQESLKVIVSNIEKGVPLSIPLEKNRLFPAIFTQMVVVGEQTGRMDEILGSIANYYEQQTDNKLKGIVSLIEPLLIVLVGLLVGFMVFAIIMPIYNLARLM